MFSLGYSLDLHFFITFSLGYSLDLHYLCTRKLIIMYDQIREDIR